jgi:hypothetical protein
VTARVLVTYDEAHRLPRRGGPVVLHDWMKCINCKVHAKNGEIRHLRTCPDYVRPKANATSVRLGDVLRTRG